MYPTGQSDPCFRITPTEIVRLNVSYGKERPLPLFPKLSRLFCATVTASCYLFSPCILKIIFKNMFLRNVLHPLEVPFSYLSASYFLLFFRVQFYLECVCFFFLYKFLYYTYICIYIEDNSVL